jgi:hypothetical protein
MVAACFFGDLTDGPSMTFIKRIEKLAAAPPGEGWDGAWHLERK